MSRGKERLTDQVFLTPTDTTIGFVSQNEKRLSRIKKRPPDKYYIKALPSLAALSALARVPEIHKNRVRRAGRTTYVFPNGQSYRIIKENCHLSLIRKLSWAYTTSANQSGKDFDKDFAINAADIIVKYPDSNRLNAPSVIIKINTKRMKRLR